MKKADGFSLVEMLVATAIIMTGVAALARVATLSVDATADARRASIATVLAAAKLEDLRSRAWSELSAMMCSEAALAVRMNDCVDYIDAVGGSIATVNGAQPPSGAVYVRQWAVTSAPGATATIALQVLVTRWGDRRATNTAHLLTAHTRWRL